jgi:DNA-binding MarR family transcriptional regulator/GNAT superfamily N-acetyltransferase
LRNHQLNFYERVGELIFGTRLKRISEKFLTDVTKIYRSLDIAFETSWFPIFYLLNEKEKLSVTEIANELQITHSAVSQMVSLLEKKKLISFLDDKSDKRRRLIAFTKKGKDLMLTILPVWDSIQRATRQLFEKKENSAYILTALSELEDTLEHESLHDRVMKDIQQDRLGEIDIKALEPADKTEYKNLILHWLIDHQNSHIADDDLINCPEIMIRQNQAIVLLAKVQKESVGTIAVQMKNSHTAQIVYLVVEEKWQKRQIGKKLLQDALSQMRNHQITTAEIHLDRRLTHAIKLLKGEDFVLQSVQSNGSENNTKETTLHLTRTLNK